MPVYATQVRPSDGHRFLRVFIYENQDALHLIAEATLDLLIVLRGVVIIRIILASLADEALE